MDPSMRWPLAIAAGFLILFLVDAAYIYTALQVQDPIDPSYKAERR